VTLRKGGDRGAARVQRAALQQSFLQLCIMDPTSGLPVRSAIDTVERFQGGERTVRNRMKEAKGPE
jgi:hypothetical protein